MKPHKNNDVSVLSQKSKIMKRLLMILCASYMEGIKMIMKKTKQNSRNKNNNPKRII